MLCEEFFCIVGSPQKNNLRTHWSTHANRTHSKMNALFEDNTVDLEFTVNGEVETIERVKIEHELSCHDEVAKELISEALPGVRMSDFAAPGSATEFFMNSEFNLPDYYSGELGQAMDTIRIVLPTAEEAMASFLKERSDSAKNAGEKRKKSVPRASV